MPKTGAFTQLSRLYERLIGIGNMLRPIALLFVRLFWGWRLYLSGLTHLTHVPKTYQNFVEWGIPFPKFNVYVSGITELVGGLLLLAGLFTRGTALIVFFNFCVAMLATSRGDIAGLFTGPERWEHLRAVVDDNAFPFLTLALVLFAFGPGKWSIDRLLQRFVWKKVEPHTLAPI